MPARLTSFVYSTLQKHAAKNFKKTKRLFPNIIMISQRSFYALQISLEDIWITITTPSCFIESFFVSYNGLIRLFKKLVPRFVKLKVKPIDDQILWEILRNCKSMFTDLITFVRLTNHFCRCDSFAYEICCSSCTICSVSKLIKRVICKRPFLETNAD